MSEVQSGASPILPFLSVIIPTWNRADVLRKTLESLLTQDYPRDRWEVVVADDGSTDHTAAVTAECAARARVPIRYARGKHAGTNEARNTGIAVAQGDALVFLDDDENAPPTHLACIAGHLVARPEIAGVGGPYRDGGNSRVPTCPRCEPGAARLPFDTITDSWQLFGGNMTIRRHVIAEVGPFDTSLSGRGDETEWFARATRNFVYDPELYIHHRRNEMSLGEQCRAQFRQGRGKPLSALKRGRRYRPRPELIPRQLAHAFRHWCGHGIVAAARELGATYEWLRLGCSSSRVPTRSRARS